MKAERQQLEAEHTLRQQLDAENAKISKEAEKAKEKAVQLQHELELVTRKLAQKNEELTAERINNLRKEVKEAKPPPAEDPDFTAAKAIELQTKLLADAKRAVELGSLAEMERQMQLLEAKRAYHLKAKSDRMKADADKKKLEAEAQKSQQQ